MPLMWACNYCGWGPLRPGSDKHGMHGIAIYSFIFGEYHRSSTRCMTSRGLWQLLILVTLLLLWNERINMGQDRTLMCEYVQPRCR